MENKTYLEILAENDSVAREDYAINPKELFVEQNDVPSDQELEGDEHNEHVELENKEDIKNKVFFSQNQKHY